MNFFTASDIDSFMHEVKASFPQLRWRVAVIEANVNDVYEGGESPDIYVYVFPSVVEGLLNFRRFKWNGLDGSLKKLREVMRDFNQGDDWRYLFRANQFHPNPDEEEE